MGPQLVVYKQDCCYIGTYIGGLFVVQFDDLLKTVGAISNNCVVELLGQHVVLSDSDVVLHGNGGARSILDKRLRRTLFREIDPTYYWKSFVFSSPNTKEVWICYPEENHLYANKAIIWNYQDDTTSIRELHLKNISGGLGRQTSDSAGDEYSPATHTLFTCDLTGLIYRHNFEEKYGATNPLCFVEKRAISVEKDTSYRKVLNGLWLDIDGDGSQIEVYVGAHDRVDATPVYSGPYYFTAGTTDYVPVLEQGRLFALKLQWNNGAVVQLNRVLLDWMPAGRF
jgi:hypothetical protein